MTDIKVYSAICSKCKKEAPHLIHLSSRNKGIKLISTCHQAIAKRNIRFDRLIPYDFDKAFEEAQKELENQNNQPKNGGKK